MKNQPNIQLFLIGGTSHSGKSSLGAHLAQKFGWDYASTDKLAKHPGRPWRRDGAPIPAHVAAHYASLEPAALLQAVWVHYRTNLFPLIVQLIETRRTNKKLPGLILEGSAVLPELRSLIDNRSAHFLWLGASEEVLTQRIHAESQYSQRSPEEKFLIDRFVARTTGFDVTLRSALESAHQNYFDMTRSRSTASVADEVVRRLGIQFPSTS